VVSQLLEICRREKVRIYHGHDYKTNVLGLLLRWFHPMRLVTTVHGWVRHTSRTPLYYRIDKTSLLRYERVTCVSEDLVQTCRRLGVSQRRLILLENGIDLTDFSRHLTPTEAKRQLGFDPDRPLVGGVGRLSAEKGFDLLIEAVARLRDNGWPLQLVIVGEGDEQSRLQALLEQRGLHHDGRLAGFQADPRPFYQALDIFALSSRREGLPNVVLEAMAMGVPCVATAIAGVPRLIQDGVNGRLIPPDDIDALTMALQELLADRNRREIFAAAARQTVEARYSFAQRMEKLARLYDELLAGPPSHARRFEYLTNGRSG
jgi:glycosyltransferase involved in cell wall biosynthesis